MHKTAIACVRVHLPCVAILEGKEVVWMCANGVGFPDSLDPIIIYTNKSLSLDPSCPKLRIQGPKSLSVSARASMCHPCPGRRDQATVIPTDHGNIVVAALGSTVPLSLLPSPAA